VRICNVQRVVTAVGPFLLKVVCDACVLPHLSVCPICQTGQPSRPIWQMGRLLPHLSATDRRDRVRSSFLWLYRAFLYNLWGGSLG